MFYSGCIYSLQRRNKEEADSKDIGYIRPDIELHKARHRLHKARHRLHEARRRLHKARRRLHKARPDMEHDGKTAENTT